jgi:hypothetical protein
MAGARAEALTGACHGAEMGFLDVRFLAIVRGVGERLCLHDRCAMRETCPGAWRHGSICQPSGCRLAIPPSAARKTLLLGALLLAAQNLVVALAIRFSGDATAVNIVYSSRCVLSVVLAWATAGWLGSREATLPRAVLLLRLAGALLLAAAILMVLL